MPSLPEVVGKSPRYCGVGLAAQPQSLFVGCAKGWLADDWRLGGGGGWLVAYLHRVPLLDWIDTDARSSRAGSLLCLLCFLCLSGRSVLKSKAFPLSSKARLKASSISSWTVHFSVFLLSTEYGLAFLPNVPRSLPRPKHPQVPNTRGQMTRPDKGANLGRTRACEN